MAPGLNQTNLKLPLSKLEFPYSSVVALFDIVIIKAIFFNMCENCVLSGAWEIVL